MNLGMVKLGLLNKKTRSGRVTTGRLTSMTCMMVLLWCGACSGDDSTSSSSTTSSAASSGVGGMGAGGVGAGGMGAGGMGTGGMAAGGMGGAGGISTDLDTLLDALRSDLDAALLAQSRGGGWPAQVQGGHLFVSTDQALTQLAGDHNGWTGTAMTADSGFWWLVVAVPPASQYKFTNGTLFVADPWSRAYSYDQFGLMSQLPGPDAHLERHFRVAGASLQDRTVRVWVPTNTPTHVLYAHDGQNLFDPGAIWGGWQLQQSVPSAMMVVAIDNTPARIDEYTHVNDDIGGGPIGGMGDAHADMLEQVVRPLVQMHYGEPSKVGLLGSSLGGLISLHAAHRFAGQYDFVASMSGTVGWGSIGLSGGNQNETIIERYAAQGHAGTAIYIDSGGNGSCFDSDNDGIEDDDPSSSDNYCENKQLESVLVSAGYNYGVDLWHYHDPGAPHNEAAWAARVFQPLNAFAGL